MPTAPQILAALAQLAQEWWVLAVLWHIYVVVLVAALVLRWRPAKPIAALLLVVPLASVVAMAWLGGNPFTTLVFGAVLIGALVICWRLPRTLISYGTVPFLVGGTFMILFGLVYPHFLGRVSWITYVYAAPVGIVPCPTVSIVVGFSFAFGSLGSRSWGLLIGSAGLFYGVFGALYLGVTLDWVLFLGALALMLSSLRPPSQDAALAA